MVSPIDEEEVLALSVCEFRSDFCEPNEWSTELEVPYRELFEYCKFIFWKSYWSWTFETRNALIALDMLALSFSLRMWIDFCLKFSVYPPLKSNSGDSVKLVDCLTIGYFWFT